MIFQFTTGSVQDRQRHGIRISVLNAGIQMANVMYTFQAFRGEKLESVVEQSTKVPPQQETLVLEKVGLKDVHCEILLKVDSPSLIVTILGETRYPLHCQTVFVDDIEADEKSLVHPPHSVSLLWGYMSKGAPF